MPDNNGVLEISRYDLLGNLIESTTCKGVTPYTTTYQYSNFGKISSITQPYEVDGNLTTTKKIMQYDTLGNLRYVQNLMDTPTDTSDDICELYSYNIASLRVEEQCRQRYNGNEAITTYTDYDENGNVTSKIDGNEVETTYEYDELNRMTSSSVTAGGVEQTTTYDYDLNGNLIRTTDWRGNVDKYKYDPMNRLYEKTDAKGVAFEKLEYNNKNQQVKSYDAYNRLTTFEYDANGRLVCTTDPEDDTQTQEYDNMGNVRAKYDGRGYETSYTYDILGRLTEVYNEGILKSSYSYYIDGTLKEQDLGGFVTTYYYNPSGNLKKVCDPNGIGVASKTETYEYTPTGLLEEKTDRNGNTTTYSYDCHGRLKQQITGDSSTSITTTISPSETDIGYDGNGNIERITVENKKNGVVQSTIATERTFDDLNRVKTKKETTVEDGITTVVGPIVYNYDITTGVGEIKEESIYPGSRTVEKVYDTVGRLKTVTADGETTEYEYYDDGRRQSVTYNGDFQQVYTYNAKGLLDTLTNKVKNSQGVFVESEYYRYLYDASNNMRSKQERIGGISNTTTYNYDKMNRLLRVFEPQRTIAYTYDSRGNRATETVITGSDRTYTQYTYTDNNRIQYETKRQNDASGQIIQKKQYQYDNNGNMTAVVDITNGSTNLTINTYTLLNQLETSWTQEFNKTMENTYNAEGKRVAKAVDGGQSVRYFYEYNDVVFEYVNGGAVTVFNVIGTNLISREIGSDKVYYFYNGHGDVTALLDATTKNIRSQYQYDSFGNITLEKYYDSNGALTTDPDDMIKSQIRYAGYQYDEESDYYNLHARYYDPKIARFLQQDTYTGTIDDPLSLNLYTYVLNNPIKYYDPFGYWDVPVGTANRSQGNTVEWKAGSTTGNSTITITTAMGATQTIREGTDFYIGTDNLAYYVNRPENAVKTTNSGSDVKWTAGAETGRSTITVTPKGMFGRLQTDKSTTLTEGVDYYIGNDGTAYYYGGVRVTGEVHGNNVTFNSSDTAGASTISVKDPGGWFGIGSSTTTLKEGADYYIGADGTAYYFGQAPRIGPIEPAPPKPNVELLGQAGVAAVWAGQARRIVPLTDLNTGLTFNISWAVSSGYHTDWSPATTADVDVIKSILNPNGDNRNWNNTSSWSWNSRPGVITVDERYIAVGFHLRPHAMNFSTANGLPNASNTMPSGGWPLGGHMCMFYGSGGGGAVGTMNAGNAAAKEAFELSK